MKLYLIRHGQSDANIKRYFAGQMQVNLTDNGILQAKYAGELIKHIKFDKVYSSDLFRAMDTQKYALPDFDCETTSLLREIDVGNLSGILLSDCLEKYGDALRKNIADYDFKPYGGEDSIMLKARVKDFLDLITDSNHNTIAAFCHGGIITAVIEYLLGINTDKYFFEASNCSVTILDYTDKRWKLQLYNYTGPNI